jgi:WD40 repeat protein
LLHVFSHGDLIWSVEISPNGRLLACSAVDGTISIWDLKTKTLTRTIDFADVSLTLYFSPDGKTLACSDTEYRGDTHFHCVKLWDVRSGELIKTMAAIQSQGIQQLVFSPDGSQLAFGGDAGVVQVWNVANRSETFKLTGHIGAVESLLYSPDGNRLLSSDQHGVKFWDVITGKLQFELDAHDDAIAFLAMTRDAKTLITGSVDDTVKMWRAATTDDVSLMRQKWNELQPAL